MQYMTISCENDARISFICFMQSILTGTSPVHDYKRLIISLTFCNVIFLYATFILKIQLQMIWRFPYWL